MGYLEVFTPTGMEADISSLSTKEAGGLYKTCKTITQQLNLKFSHATDVYQMSI
jgi:hypothetical protein